MKKFLIATALLTAALSAAAEGFAYHGTITNPDGTPSAGTTVSVSFAINTPAGVTVYSESHPAVTADNNGRLTFTVGEGAPTTGSFRMIDWSIEGLEAEVSVTRPGGMTTVTTETLSTTPYAMGASSASGLVTPMTSNKRRYTLAVDDNGTLSTRTEESRIVPIPAGYTKCIFHDEFDYEGLPDPRYWGYEVGYVRSGEMQYYTEARIENAFVKDGKLHLRCLKDDYVAPDGTVCPVTSASVTTQDKVKFTYGRVDVHAKVPNIKGSWPAIWMMPNDSRFGGWPNSGEIDIMESVGHAPNVVYFTAHCAGQNTDHKQYHSSAYVTNCHTEFHTYSVVWNEKRLEFLVDGKRKIAFVNNSTTWRDWPFMFDFYVILNYAYGGSWGGQEGTDVTLLPSTFEIDYVRIFQ